MESLQMNCLFVCDPRTQFSCSICHFYASVICALGFLKLVMTDCIFNNLISNVLKASLSFPCALGHFSFFSTVDVVCCQTFFKHEWDWKLLQVRSGLSFPLLPFKTWFSKYKSQYSFFIMEYLQVEYYLKSLKYRLSKMMMD